MKLAYSIFTLTTNPMTGVGNECAKEVTFNARDKSGEYQIVARDRLAVAAAAHLKAGDKARILGHTVNDWKEVTGRCECGRDIVTRMIYISAEDIQVKRQDWRGILELQPLLL
jgi:hypothetical protein